MLIFDQDGWRVNQHPHLMVFHIERWMEGDDRRGYGTTWDYFGVRECYSIEEVEEYLRDHM